MSGKTNLIDFISRYFKRKKIKFIKLREPGGSKNSELIRKLILNKKNKFNPLTDLLLYLAARNENIENIIKNNYKKKIILLDRFIDSTIAYQHYGMGLSNSLIKTINKVLLGKLHDKKTVIIFAKPDRDFVEFWIIIVPKNVTFFYYLHWFVLALSNTIVMKMK